KASTSNGTNTRREIKAREGELRNQLYREITPLNKRIEEIETLVETISSRVNDIEKMMADPSHYEDSKNVVDVNIEYLELKDKLSALTTQWDALIEAAEEIKEKYRLAREG
ncbi:MAG: ABC transporter C-terminal domain-containing protein, partial [Dehalococcoidales bacterium]|nr:ABC transporter C-terminal domain-containing protein [Dehalococcoidales bacterium]